MNFINFKRANCKNCYKCIRVCPVKAIKINEDEHAEIVDRLCISCGRCLESCPQNAKTIKNDTALVQSYLGKYRTAVSIAPSFAGALDFDPIKIVSVLKKLGFDWVGETAAGVDIISDSYLKIYESNEWDVAITTACPTVNMYIQKYHHNLLKYLVPIASPMLAHGKYIKETLGKDTKVIFIGPCLSKKNEAHESGSIDAVLTFEELDDWIKDEDIAIDKLPVQKFDNEGSINASLYPVPGKTTDVLNHARHRCHIVANGLADLNELILSLNKNELKNCWIEATACKGSCLKGPGMKSGISFYLAKQKVLEYHNYKKAHNAASNRFKYNIKVFKGYPKINLELKYPSEQEIKNILKKIGKHSPEEELNCGACGYNTCREKALYVYNHIANTNMCIPYMRSKAESQAQTIINNTPNAIIVLNENLDILEMNKSALHLFYIKEENILKTNINDIMDAKPFINILSNQKSIRNKRVDMPKFGIIVDMSLYYLKDEHLIMAMFTDITDVINKKKNTDLLKQKTAKMAQDVILKQMTTAQEIASLLGETAADTRVMLNKLIALLKDGDMN